MQPPPRHYGASALLFSRPSFYPYALATPTLRWGWWVGEKARPRSCALAPPLSAVARIGAKSLPWVTGEITPVSKLTTRILVALSCRSNVSHHAQSACLKQCRN
eukprot:4489682-Pleurochrysis_carterae.AAC.1